MSGVELQQVCARGQELLEHQEYVDAEQTLVSAEREALRLKDWDTLSRLYMPLQEARRQRRQRTMSGGVICLDLVSQGPSDVIEGRHVLDNYAHGQLLVAGWGTIVPALQARKLQARFKLYVDVFLAAKFPLIGGGHAVVIFPHENVVVPDLSPRRFAELSTVMPAHVISLREEELPAGVHPSGSELQKRIDDWWQRLHLPFLADARNTADLKARIDAYRKVIRIDYACELAHQELAATARELARLEAVNT